MLINHFDTWYLDQVAPLKSFVVEPLTYWPGEGVDLPFLGEMRGITLVDSIALAFGIDLDESE